MTAEKMKRPADRTQPRRPPLVPALRPASAAVRAFVILALSAKRKQLATFEVWSTALKPTWVSGTILLAVLLGCGGSSRPSGVSSRAFVTNAFGGTAAPSGLVQVVNDSTDILSTAVISV